jgi:hypothetical protein
MAEIKLSLVIEVPKSFSTDRWYAGQGARAQATFDELTQITGVWKFHDFEDVVHDIQVDVFHSPSAFPPLSTIWQISSAC